MSEERVKEDPVKMHKDANALMESGKYEEAMELFLRAADLYKKVQNFFDSATMYYKAGECSYTLKDYEKAIEHFTKSAELSFQKGFDRYGVSALEYARDCHKALGNKKEVSNLQKKIKEVKKKLENSF
ncbi:MAG: tetratricopeptide repeat protein [Candidatus Bathycorpusculaceae bacterium]